MLSTKKLRDYFRFCELAAATALCYFALMRNADLRDPDREIAVVPGHSMRCYAANFVPVDGGL